MQLREDGMFDWVERVKNYSTTEELKYCVEMLRYAPLNLGTYKEPQSLALPLNACTLSTAEKRSLTAAKRRLEYSTYSNGSHKALYGEYEGGMRYKLDRVLTGLDIAVASCEGSLTEGLCQRHRNVLKSCEWIWDYYVLIKESERNEYLRSLPPKLPKRTVHEEFAQRGLEACVYCGGPFEHIDHVFPKALGGTDEWDNFVPSCAHCNTSKNAKNPWIWMEKVFPGQDHAAMFKLWGVKLPPLPA